MAMSAELNAIFKKASDYETIHDLLIAIRKAKGLITPEQLAAKIPFEGSDWHVEFKQANAASKGEDVKKDITSSRARELEHKASELLLKGRNTSRTVIRYLKALNLTEEEDYNLRRECAKRDNRKIEPPKYWPEDFSDISLNDAVGRNIEYWDIDRRKVMSNLLETERAMRSGDEDKVIAIFRKMLGNPHFDRDEFYTVAKIEQNYEDRVPKRHRLDPPHGPPSKGMGK